MAPTGWMMRRTARPPIISTSSADKGIDDIRHDPAYLFFQESEENACDKRGQESARRRIENSVGKGQRYLFIVKGGKKRHCCIGNGHRARNCAQHAGAPNSLAALKPTSMGR